MTLEQAIKTIQQNACPIRKAADKDYAEWYNKMQQQYAKAKQNG